jgi:hypothetical protein
MNKLKRSLVAAQDDERSQYWGRRAFVLGLLLLQQTSPAPASAAPAAPEETLSFHFERQGLPVPVFTLTVHPDGSAVYQASYAPEVPRYSPYAASIQALPNTEVTVNVVLTPATTSALFAEARATDGFHGGCNSRAKNIADTGAKTIKYVSAAGTASCTYNFSEDKNVVALTNTFEAIAFTLDEGRKIEMNHRYDRLALDHETEFLVSEAKLGHAVEIAAIAPALRSLIDDPQVMERVRTRAANLLAQAGATP